jgi:hypothetical protein
VSIEPGATRCAPPRRLNNAGPTSEIDPTEALAWHTGGRLTASGYANLSVLREGARVAGVPLLPAGIPIEFGCKNDPQEAR